MPYMDCSIPGLDQWLLQPAAERARGQLSRSDVKIRSKQGVNTIFLLVF